MKKRDFLKTMPLWITPIVTITTLPAHAQTSPIPDDNPVINPVENPTDDPCTQDAECGENFPSFKMNENVVCNQGRGESVCPVAYRILAGPPTRPAQYTVYEEGFIDPIGSDCYDFTPHIDDMMADRGLSIYCIEVFQVDCHPEEYTSYCWGQGK